MARTSATSKPYTDRKWHSPTEFRFHGFLLPAGHQRTIRQAIGLLFNETHTLNGNRMYKWNDDRSLRLQAGYTHNRITTATGQIPKSIINPTDTIQIDETYHYCLQNDATANMEIHYEDNSRPSTIYRTASLAESETNRGTFRRVADKRCAPPSLRAKEFLQPYP